MYQSSHLKKAKRRADINEAAKRSDPAYAKLLRNIERFTALVFEAFEKEESATISFHIQKGRAAGFKIQKDAPPVA